MYDGTREKTFSPEKRVSAKVPATSEVSLVPFTFSIQALWRQLKPVQHGQSLWIHTPGTLILLFSVLYLSCFYAFLTVTLYYRRVKSITKLPSQQCILNDKSTSLYKFVILFVKEEMHSVWWCSEYKPQLALSPENCPQSEALISSRPWHDFTLSRFVSVVSGINNTWDPVGSTSSRKACKMYSLTVQV